jgi:hypothetical protein
MQFLHTVFKHELGYTFVIQNSLGTVFEEVYAYVSYVHLEKLDIGTQIPPQKE